MEYNYTRDEYLQMYRDLKRGRIFVEKMHESVYKGYVKSSFHSPHGQEALGVGIISAIRDTDWFAYTHRMQTACIMRVDLYKYVAEIFAKRDGMHKGVAFDIHCTDYSVGARLLAPLGTLGGMVPMYTGLAWALKKEGKDEIVVITHGEGGCSQGSVYEGWNIASLYKVPAVFVIENNEWAMTVPLSGQSTNPDVSERAIPMGLSTQIVDGNDILAVRQAMDIAVAKARNFEPNVVEMKTLRWDAHFVGQGNDYRTDKEKIQDYMQNNDPVKRYEAYLLEKGLLDETRIAQLAHTISEEIDNCIEQANLSPYPTKEELFLKENVYASPETGGDL